MIGDAAVFSTILSRAAMGGQFPGRTNSKGFDGVLMEDSLTQTLKDLWAKPFGSLPTSTDLGRLAKRIDVFTSDGGNDSGNRNSRSDEGDKSDDLPNAWYLGRALQSVASKLESPNEYPRVLDAINKFKVNAGTQPDLESYIKELFSALDESSPTVKIFKLINQAALAAAITRIKLSTAMNGSSLKPETLMTKDVRTADGWRISIDINPSEICLSHARREQSLVSF